jgi:hypothetical protein
MQGFIIDAYHDQLFRRVSVWGNRLAILERTFVDAANRIFGHRTGVFEGVVPRQPFLPVATIIFAGRRQVNRCSHLMVSGRCDAQIWPTLVASSFPEKRL